MVIGFDKFKEKFQSFTDNYIVIGGSACDWIFTHRDAHFRATKDIDLVICAEEMSPIFAASIWDFIHEGGYDAYERKDGKKCFYRFLNLSIKALLILKAKAWMDLSARKMRGEFVKDKDLSKHRKDVFRLQSLIDFDEPMPLSPPLFKDFTDFLAAIRLDPINPQTLGAIEDFDEAMEKLEAIFTEAR